MKKNMEETDAEKKATWSAAWYDRKAVYRKGAFITFVVPVVGRAKRLGTTINHSHSSC
jgi:hypothetical protein